MTESITNVWIFGYFVLKSFLISKLKEVLLSRDRRLLILGQKITNFEFLSAHKSCISQAVLPTNCFESYFK